VKNRLLPAVIALGVTPGEASGLTVHSAIAAASSLPKLVRYFKVCTLNEEETAESSGVQHLLLCSQYESSLAELTDLVKPNIRKISKDSAKAALKRKDEIRKRDPEVAKLKPGALQRYYFSS
jgi:hypothetical protein